MLSEKTLFYFQVATAPEEELSEISYTNPSVEEEEEIEKINEDE